MAELSSSIIYGNLTATGDQYVKGQLTIDGGLTVNGDISVSGTVDGVNISSHASDSDAHHSKYTDSEASTAAPVQSVAGKTGSVSLTSSDVGLGNVPNTNIAYSSAIAAGSFTTAEVSNLRAAKLDDGSTPWTAHNYYTFSESYTDLSDKPFTTDQASNLSSNTLADGSTPWTAHNYFSGSHNDLSNIGSSDHHSKYTDSEAVSAVDGSSFSHLNIEDHNGGDYTADGDIHFDSSEGLFLYATQQCGNVYSGSDGYLILSANNISAGTGISISGGKGDESGPVTFSIDSTVTGGLGMPQLMPENMSLDDTNTEVARGTAFSMIETIDYNSTSADGSAWIIFYFPALLDAGKNINLDLYYHLNGSDDSKVVVFKTEYWCKAIGEVPSPDTPDGSNSDNISTGTGEDGEIRSESLTAIPNSAIAAGDTIILKLTREGSNGSDTYTGTFQMLYLIPSQS